MAGQILASLDDIDAQLPDNVIQPDDQNTALLQISVARVVRAYLSTTIDNTTLASWTEPDLTPDIVREASSKLIASQLFFQETSKSSLDMDIRSIGQLLYDQGIALLQQIVAGEIDIPNVDEITTGSITALDFWPVDATDRAFTVGMEL